MIPTTGILLIVLVLLVAGILTNRVTPWSAVVCFLLVVLVVWMLA